MPDALDGHPVFYIALHSFAEKAATIANMIAVLRNTMNCC